MALEPPAYEAFELAPRRTRYCFLVTTLDEGDRLRGQLQRMAPQSALAYIVLADGGSTDGSTDQNFLRNCGVRALLVTQEAGLGTALRMGFHYALAEGYEGVVTVDGNGKDGVESLPEFLRLLDEGYDFVQGSRFLDGGSHLNTPLDRHMAIRFIVAPLLRLSSGWSYTDPTNGFKAMSRRFLTDARVQPIRSLFRRFNMQFYLNYRAPKLGFQVCELAVARVYPKGAPVPTKITKLRTKALIVAELLRTVMGAYNPGAPK